MVFLLALYFVNPSYNTVPLTNAPGHIRTEVAEFTGHRCSNWSSGQGAFYSDDPS